MLGLIWDGLAALLALALCIGMIRTSRKIGNRRLKGWSFFLWGFAFLLLGVLIHLAGLPLSLDGMATISHLGGMAFLLVGLRKWADGLDELDRLEREKDAIMNACGNVAIEFLDPEYRVIWANQAAVDLYDTGTLEGLKGRHCYQVVHGQGEPCTGCNAVEAMQSGTYHQSEVSRPDGRTFFVQSQPVYDRGGDLIGVVNADTDITDRKKDEEALRRSEEKYRNLVETINEAIFEVDANGIVTYISPGIHQILGYRPEEIIGDAFIDYVFSDDQQRLAERFVELADGETRALEYRIVSASGRPHWVETFSRPRFADDRFLGVVGVMTDVDQRKRLEKEAGRHKQLLEATLNSTADGILAIDREGRLLTWNRRFEVMWRLSEEKMKQVQTIDDLVVFITDQFEGNFQLGGKGLFKTTADETKREIILKNNRVFEVVSYPLSGASHSGGLVWNFRDISRTKQAEEALLRSEKRYRSLYQNVPVGLFRTTPDGQILSANPALAKLLGYDREEDLITTPSTRFYARVEIREQLIAELNRNETVSLEAIEMRRRDGSSFWASLHAVKVVDREGQFLYLDGELKDVTKRIQAECALRESEEKYRILVENAHDGIFVTRNGQVRFANPSTCRILGYTVEEMDKMPLEQIVHPDDVATVLERHHARMAGENPTNHYSLRALRKTGETLYLELQAVKVDWENCPSILCIVRDISERKEAEEKLLEEKQFSETVINSLPGVFYLYEENGRLRRWNTNMEKVTGLAPEQLGRMRLLDWFAAGDQQLAASAFMDVLEKGEGQAEISVLTPSGRKRPYFFSGRKLTIQGRSYLLGSGLDFTKRKKLEHALRESERRFRNLVEKMPFGISILINERVIYRNPAQEKSLGKLGDRVSLEEALLPSEDLKRYLAACRYVAKTSAPVEDLEVRFYPYDKPQESHHLKWMHCSIHPIDYLNQEALLISMVDLTRMKELEKQVLIREKMASLGHVAAGIAHEIRNPLSGINVLLEGIKENFEEPDSAGEIKDLINATQQASDKIAGVIRKVLDFSRPSVPKMESIDINAPVRDAVQMTELTMRRSDIGIEKALTPQLSRFYGDHQLIEQVVLNLINNAVAAMEKQTSAKKVMIRSWQEAELLFLSVADSGPGVPEELQKPIFTPFFTTGSKGSGIGLSFCQRVVSDHGGSISVGASQWGGADFTICLPLEKRNFPR